jgi:GT2 family glycosyltransferase
MIWMELREGARLLPHAVASLRHCFADPAVQAVFADEIGPLEPDGLAIPWLKTAFDPDRNLEQAMAGRCIAFRLGAPPFGTPHAMTLALGPPSSPGRATPIRHWPEVLLWRGADDVAPWRDGFDADAVRAALETDGRGATWTGTRVRWPIPEPAPLISVIVPTRDNVALLRPCIEGLLHRTDWPNLEVLIADNDTTESDALAFLKEVAGDPRVRVLPCPGPFNYSAINNQAARSARGELLLLLNNDTEVVSPNWLRDMASLASRPEIGAVGARLLYPSGQIQHQGVTLGLGGVAGHEFGLNEGDFPGPADALFVTRSVSAATAACLMMRRSVFEAAGGLDEEVLKVAYNDVDLCIRIGRLGLRLLVTPAAELLHKESASRGDDMSPAHRARWDRECRAMLERWGPVLTTDPFWPLDANLRDQRTHVPSWSVITRPYGRGGPR